MGGVEEVVEDEETQEAEKGRDGGGSFPPVSWMLEEEKQKMFI